MTEAFSLKDHEHNLAVLVTMPDARAAPVITFMDRRDGQQVSVSANVFFQLVDAIACALDQVEEIEGEDDGEATTLQ